MLYIFPREKGVDPVLRILYESPPTTRRTVAKTKRNNWLSPESR